MTLGGGEDPMEKLTRLIIERDELLFHVVPELKAEYMFKVGALEHLVWKKRLELSMAKRRLALIRSYLNRQEEPDSEVIEETIRFEYENLLEDLKERNEEIKKISDLGGHAFVTVPCDKAYDHVYYVSEGGMIEEIPCAYNAETNTLDFTLVHFSVYTITVGPLVIGEIENDLTMFIAIAAVVLLVVTIVVAVVIKKR